MISAREFLTQMKGRQKYLADRKIVLDAQLQELIAEVKDLTAARDVVNSATQATQNQIKAFIEDVVSLCLKSVFGDTYGFRVEYEIRRNKSEANLYVLENDQKFVPADECGCGVLDIASIGLRLALWALADPKPASILFLDEPARHLGASNTEKFGQMLTKLSEMFGLQIIMISHNQQLIEGADRAFRVEKINGESSVEVLS